MWQIAVLHVTSFFAKENLLNNFHVQTRIILTTILKEMTNLLTLLDFSCTCLTSVRTPICIIPNFLQPLYCRSGPVTNMLLHSHSPLNSLLLLMKCVSSKYQIYFHHISISPHSLPLFFLLTSTYHYFI